MSSTWWEERRIELSGGLRSGCFFRLCLTKTSGMGYSKKSAIPLPLQCTAPIELLSPRAQTAKVEENWAPKTNPTTTAIALVTRWLALVVWPQITITRSQMKWLTTTSKRYPLAPDLSMGLYPHVPGDEK
ncbi:hypothetical protein ACU8KH_04912 [Lachancea thermotolerans]